MDEVIKKSGVIPCIVIFSVLLQTAEATNSKINDFQNFTTKARSIDEWLFSEDLFPGHIIPEKVHHHDATKMFTKLVNDDDVLGEAYKKYRVQHNKEAEDDVKYDARKVHFKDNLNFIFQHNLQHDAGQHGFQVGVNMFADMSREEWTNFLGADKIPIHPRNFNATGPHGPMPPPQQPILSAGAATPAGSLAVPVHFDLRDLNMVSPVKNQRKCGSCVHFSHGGMIETLYAVQNDGEIINVSEQMMLDCAVPEHGYENNAGCNGNIMEDSGQFLIDHGVTTEEAYKYTATLETCAKEDKHIIARLTEYYQVEATVEAFKSTLYNEHKPIAAAFLVHPPFMFYRTGVYDWCTPPHGYTGGHAILIVGYGQFFDQGYWIVKNSWGQRWGEMGYFRYIAGSTFCRFEKWGFTGTLA